MPDKARPTDHPYHKDQFIYDEETDSYTCPHRSLLCLDGGMHLVSGEGLKQPEHPHELLPIRNGAAWSKERQVVRKKSRL